MELNRYNKSLLADNISTASRFQNCRKALRKEGADLFMAQRHQPKKKSAPLSSNVTFAQGNTMLIKMTAITITSTGTSFLLTLRTSPLRER